MEKDKCFCPCCHAEITGFVHDQIVLYNRRKQVAAAKGGITRERRDEMNRASLERLRKWRLEHPGESREKALAASRARTAESFARQARTVRETAQKKSVKFAELLYEAKAAGREITPELEAELMGRAREIVKAENRAERIARKKASVTKGTPKA